MNISDNNVKVLGDLLSGSPSFMKYKVIDQPNENSMVIKCTNKDTKDSKLVYIENSKVMAHLDI